MQGNVRLPHARHHGGHPHRRRHYHPSPYHGFNGITSQFGAHFILRADKILMKERYHNAIVNGVKAGNFPRVPVDYGCRDPQDFWYTKSRRPIPQLLPIREATVEPVKYAADRIDDQIRSTGEACTKFARQKRCMDGLGCGSTFQKTGRTSKKNFSSGLHNACK